MPEEHKILLSFRERLNCLGYPKEVKENLHSRKLWGLRIILEECSNWEIPISLGRVNRVDIPGGGGGEDGNRKDQVRGRMEGESTR